MSHFLDAVIRYLLQMAVLAVPAATVFLCFFPYRRRALTAMGLRSSFQREAALVLFVMTVFGILAVTLKPTMVWHSSPGIWGDVTLYIDRPNRMTNVNLTPFYMFRIYKASYGLGDLVYIIINFIGNMAVFIPIGLFPALLFRKAKWYRSALIGCGFSVFIEVSQYFVMRQTDIDDVILNTLGALWGYWLYLLLKKLLPEFTAGFQCHQK